ncbi:MAG TPA: SRPBCC domain-containing protein [Pseudonocardiaceae bacterium]
MGRARLLRLWGQRLDALATELARGRRARRAAEAARPSEGDDLRRTRGIQDDRAPRTGTTERGTTREDGTTTQDHHLTQDHRTTSAGERPTDTPEGRFMIDIARQLAAIHREVGTRTLDDDEGVAVVLRRRYTAPPTDVWDAITDPERLRRWFMPISGDLRVGGSFQLEGNAGGDILACEPPTLLRVTFGGPASVVQLRLTSDGEDATALEFEHTVPLAMAGSGAGSLYVGPGWDGGLLGLALYLDGEVADDPVAAAGSPEVQEFSRGSIDLWAAAARDTATDEEIAAATQVALAQFAPDLQPS